MKEMNHWLGSVFGLTGRIYLIMIPILLFAGYGVYLLLFPEVASRRLILRRGIDNAQEAAARVHRRCRIIGGVMLCAAIAVLAVIILASWLGRMQ